MIMDEKIQKILHEATLKIIKEKPDPKEASQAALDWAISFAMENAGSAELGGQLAVERVREMFGQRLRGRGINDRVH